MTAEFPTICPFGECSAVLLKVRGRSHAQPLQAVLSSWMLSIEFAFLFILRFSILVSSEEQILVYTSWSSVTGYMFLPQHIIGCLKILGFFLKGFCLMSVVPAVEWSFLLFGFRAAVRIKKNYKRYPKLFFIK